MPKNKNALTRIALLDKLLADRYHAYSIQDMTNYLAEELPQYGQEGGVSKRCVEKDIRYLEYDFPIPIEFKRYTIDAHSDTTDKPYTKRCIRYADPTFSIFKPTLSDEEKGLLATALSTIGSFDGLDGFGWLDDLRKRLGFIETKPVIIMSKNLVENKTIIAEAFSAISKHAVIRLHYKPFNAEEESECVISPYLLKEYNRRWYLIGRTDKTDKLYTFALDRIKSMEVAKEYDYREAPEDVLERYEDIIGITYHDDKEILKINFWVSDKSASYIDTKPLIGSQIKIKDEEKIRSIREQYEVPSGGSLYTIECKENYELIRELCSFGGELKVLSPECIVNSVKENIQSMLKLY